MYQTKDPQYYLNCSNLQSKKDPVNPVTGKGVGGNWGWENDGSVYPTGNGLRTAVFTPYPFLENNYTTVNASVYVEVKTPSKVAYTVKAVSSLKRTSDFPPQYNDLFKDGITSGVFEGNKSELSGEIDIPVSISGRVNPQKLTVTLGNSNYYIGSIKLSARGTRSEETSTAPLNWSQTLVGGSSTSYIYTIALTDYLAWENLVVEVVVKDRTASQSRKNARKLETESEPQTETAVPETEPQTNTTETTVPETTATESPTTETTASETQTPETKPSQTQAPETSAPETTVPQTESPEPETPAPQTEQPASETAASQPETPAPQTEQPASETAAPQPETPAPQAETSAPETSAPQKETSAPPQPVETQTADTQAAEHEEAVQDSGNL